MSPSVQTIALFRDIVGRKVFKKHIFETSFKEAKYCDDLDEEKDKYIRIPNSITAIGKDAFYHCESLKKIVIPNHGLASPYSVTSIGDCAFANCESLEEIIIPNSVTSIGDSAFWGCVSLKEIIIPNSVKSIGECAFYYCKSLKEIVIPKSVTSIGKNAFSKKTNVIYE